MLIQSPGLTDYDNGLGIDQDIINYIKESHEIQSRISSTRCYVLFQNSTGSIQNIPLTVNNYVSTLPSYKALIWASGSTQPDLRPFINNNKGAISIWSDDVAMTRVLDTSDLLSDSEFVIEENKLLNPAPVYVVFNPGYNASGHIITYTFSSYEVGISAERLKRGENNSDSIFGWTQYLRYTSDAYRRPHQILVRFPVSLRDSTIEEEGKVISEESICWTIWDPFLEDFDILIVLGVDSESGKDEIYEIQNKTDSWIQKVLVSQKFNIKLLERTDPRYKISYLKV